MSASFARSVAVLLGCALCTSPPVTQPRVAQPRVTQAPEAQGPATQAPRLAPADEPPPRRIAHAGGVADGQPVTNSRQALDHSVAEGFRLIEVDFSWTRDDQLVLLHDWAPNIQRLLGLDEPTVMTRAEFLSMPSPLGLTLMDLAALGAWLEEHPGIDIVTDVKGRTLAGLTRIARRLPALRRRFVPQIHRAEHYAPARALGFERLILTLHASPMGEDDVLAFVGDHELFAVTMPFDQARGTLPRRLDAHDVFSYAHTVNDHVLWSRLAAGGTDGIYTDFLSPANEGREQRGEGFAPWTVASTETPLDTTVIPYVPPPGAGFELQLAITNQGTTSVQVSVQSHGAGIPPARLDLTLSPGQTRTLDPHRALAAAFGPGQPCWLSVSGEQLDVRARWQLVDRPALAAVVASTASSRFAWEGPIDGLAGQLVALVNPSTEPVNVTLVRTDEHGVREQLQLPLAPGAMRRMQWTLSGSGTVRVELTGGPFVVQPLRWNATLGFVR